MAGGNLVFLGFGRCRELHKLGLADLGGFGFWIQGFGLQGVEDVGCSVSRVWVQGPWEVKD